ncbi:hypothetical protein R3P38DRAFT_3208676 [Favolaschia claudopus]|uniref:Uncharacterized protein n=1 Tax=Favolaschia claudopus TaxID=2862362 RepID=A0AAW0AKA0_9AGAR
MPAPDPALPPRSSFITGRTPAAQEKEEEVEARPHCRDGDEGPTPFSSSLSITTDSSRRPAIYFEAPRRSATPLEGLASTPAASRMRVNTRFAPAPAVETRSGAVQNTSTAYRRSPSLHRHRISIGRTGEGGGGKAEAEAEGERMPTWFSTSAPTYHVPIPIPLAVSRASTTSLY